MSTEKVRLEVVPDVSLPLVGVTVSQAVEGVPTVHCKPSPPMLVMPTVCDAGLLPPAIALKLSVVVLSCMAGAATLMVMGIVTGLFATGLPVTESVAVIATLVV